MPEDGGLVRVSEESGLGIALATDGNGRYCTLDPYQGTQLALAEAYRNVAMTGAVPVAVTNCLNFGSPEDPAVMWQLAEAVRGLADGCKGLGIRSPAATSASTTRRAPPRSTRPGDRRPRRPRRCHEAARRRLRADGAECAARRTSQEFGGSAWAEVVHQHLGGRPPAVDLDAERQLAILVTAAASAACWRARMISPTGAWRSPSPRPALRGRGCAVALRGDAFTALFSESAARALVSVVPGQGAGVRGPSRRARRPRHGPWRDHGRQPDGRGRLPGPADGAQAGLERHPPAIFG